MGGNPSKFGRVERTSLSVILDKTALLQDVCGSVNKIHTSLLQYGVVLVFCSNPIQSRRSKHSDKKVCVAEPIYGFVSAAHVTENDLGVEIICELADELRLNRQLLVE
jgi:hypothetical protein